MYGFIWRKFPGPWPVKLVGMLVLFGGLGALLWFFAFPKLEPLLPFDDSQIVPEQSTDPNFVPHDEPSDPPLPSGDPENSGTILPGN
ncbi:hypothetical protein Afil01_60710 [Actinorhabdospora filicis]|uniref:Uncharacterized protein n=1 Tax=Actinorhabdospora filicis TaxID=1785913 RepID=A0A9W6SSP8_9ACTN|nr:hypothetical protein [Actinorhabdospora filicis]GLZ81264.1 hypothetical protein Afil01_60710 [Actinorhabdospora filicis]